MFHGHTFAGISLRRISRAGIRTICSTERGFCFIHHPALLFYHLPQLRTMSSSAAPAKHSSLRHDALHAELQSLAHYVVALVARVKKAYSPIMRKAALLLPCLENGRSPVNAHASSVYPRLHSCCAVYTNLIALCSRQRVTSSSARLDMRTQIESEM